MKKLLFMAIMAILACGQATAQSIKGLWISQENESKTQFVAFEFKDGSNLGFAVFNLATKKAETCDYKYQYNPKNKTIILDVGANKKDVYHIKWITKDEFVMSSKSGGFLLARQGSIDDVTSKNLPDAKSEQ